MEVIFTFDLACKKEAAHRAGGTDDAQHAEEGGRVLVGGHLFLVPKGQDNGRVKIQVNLKFSKIERKISKINIDLACKKEAAHQTGGADDAQQAEEGGYILVGGHLFLVPKGQDNCRVKIQVNLKFSKIERKISKIHFSKKQAQKGFWPLSAMFSNSWEFF